MKKRTITGAFILLALVLFVSLRHFNTYFFDVLIGIICICSSYEVSKVLNNAKFYNEATISIIFPVLYYLAFMICKSREISFGYFSLLILGIILLLVLITLLCIILSKKTTKQEIGKKSYKKYVLDKTLTTLFTLVYPTLLLGSLFILNHAGEFSWFNSQISSDLGLLLIVMLFAVSMLTDTFAYLVGSLIKGPKLCPTISPKKTISGAVGGLLGGIIACTSCYFIANNIGSVNELFISLNVSWWQFLICGLIGSIFTQIGDIFASIIKRKTFTKDYSNIFPGHGGFMDRCDGLSFNAIVVLIFALILF